MEPFLRYVRPALLLSALALLIFSSCRRVFDYSIYAADLPDGYEQRLNTPNLAAIKASGVSSNDSFTVAVLSDTHYFIDELHQAVERINSRDDILFTVICGDLSDQGLTSEYLNFHDEIIRLKRPFLTVIGNHDYLANAENIFDRMFGDRNYVLDLSRYHFIFFDNIFWEKNGRPDFGWLEQQLQNAGERTPILFSHIPPYDDQYDDAAREQHRQLAHDYGIALSVHGHMHNYHSDALSTPPTHYLVVPSTGNRQYCTITFNASGDTPVRTELVNF